jgi:hypothetical protein
MVLILFTWSLDVRSTVGIEEFRAALLPRFFELGRCDALIQWDAEATLINRIHTPTVVSIDHHAVRQGAFALRVRTLSGYDGAPDQTGASKDQRSRGSQDRKLGQGPDRTHCELNLPLCGVALAHI